jgi:predicted Zn-dependent protease
VVLALMLPGSQAQDVVLPDIGDPASSVLSPQQEQQLGRVILRELRRTLPLMADPQLNAYIRSLGYRLVASNPDAQGDFTFLVIEDKAINAFATPGGIVAINTGLILAVDNEAELASVVAHEIAHVTQRHLARMYAESGKVNLATGLAILAALVAGAYDQQAGAAGLATALAAGAQSQLNYSRANEQEADRAGIQTLANAGFNPRAMPAFFDKLQRQSGGGGADGITEYLRTHPVTSSRISDSAARADQFDGRFINDSMQFQLAQARLRALKFQPSYIIEGYEAKGGPPPNDLAAQYEYALALTSIGRTERALSVLDALLADYSDLVELRVAHAEALAKAGRSNEAASALEELNALYPDQEPVALPLARIRLDLGQPAEALSTLERLTRNGYAGPETYKTKAQAASQAGHPALSHEALAEFYAMEGQWNEALRQLDLGLKAASPDQVTERRIRSKRDQLRKALQEAED